MKKKLLSMFLLLTLLFTAGCNKEKNTDSEPTAAPTETLDPTTTPEPTATPSPTPTPVPENLAMAALETLPDSLEFLMEYTPEGTVDFSEGMGYDLSLDLTVSPEILELIGLTELETIHFDANYDIKDIMAANFTMLFGESELLNFHVFTDMNNTFLLNLPKYSDQYARFSLDELSESMEEEQDWEDFDTPSASNALSADSFKTLQTTTTVDSASLALGGDTLELLHTYLERFVDCFQPETESTANASIGTGSYTMTGEKYTISATAADLQAVIDDMAADPQVPEALAMELENLVLDGFNSFVMNYYVNDEGSFAWEVYPDTASAEPAVLISVPAGFCLYSTEADGTDTLVLYSVITGEGTGTITIPATEEGLSDTSIAYNIPDDNNASVNIISDILELTMDVSKNGDVISYDYNAVIEGISVVLEMDITSQKEAKGVMNIASYGLLLASIDMKATFREYNEIPMPTNYVDFNTWTENLDIEAFYADLEQLAEKYPFLAELLDTDEEEVEPYVPDENYSDEFMNMTGYTIGEEGFVFFIPLEEEVLAIGKPSTGYDRYPVSDEVRQALLNLGSKTFPALTPEVYTNYTISGFVEDNTVSSHYLEEHIYLLNEDYEAYCSIAFDAISHELLWISIYHKTPEEALSVINEALAILGLEAATVEDLNNSASRGDLYLYGFEDELGYGAAIMVTPEE